MRRKLVVTLTTVKGSKQYTLGQIAKYIVALFLLLSVLSFFVSNLLLVHTSDELLNLSAEHQLLNDEYRTAIDNQESYQSRLQTLNETLATLTHQRDELVAERAQMGHRLSSLDTQLVNIESILGMNDPQADEDDAKPATESPLPADPVKRAQLVREQARYRQFMLYSIPNGQPVTGGRISDPYGWRTNPVTHKRQLHKGMDFAVNLGTPVYATADGVVEFAGYSRGSGYGRLVRLGHNFGFKSYYGHLKKVLVHSGQFVHKGQKIALSGSTGRSTGPHLHYEVRYLYTAVNPKPFLHWDIDHFDSLFAAVKGVKWESLSELYPLKQMAQQ